MKFLVALVLAVACARADVSHIVRSGEASANIVRSESEVKSDGFSYTYETENGIRSTVNGLLKNVNAENPAQEITGEYSYTGPDGVVYTVKFVANENGYQPQGDHLPVPPPVPEAIQRSLIYNAAHPQAEDKFSPVSAPVVRPVANAFNAPQTFAARNVPKTSKFQGRF